MTRQTDTSSPSRATIEARLRAGETAADIADDCCLDTHTDVYGVEYVVLAGWTVDDGNCTVYYPHAESGSAAAQDYVDGGDWGDDDDGTQWIRVYTWREAVGIDGDGYIVSENVAKARHTITIEPEEPECEDGQDHEWASDHDVVGGAEDNPGVWGHGAGLIYVEHCRRCGCGRHTDTWAQDPATGEQGLTSVRYEPGEFSDAGGEE